jgi:integrase
MEHQNTRMPRRQRRKMLTDRMVSELKRKAKAYVEPDPELGGHVVRVHPKGPPHVFYVITRDAFKKQRWVKIASTAELTIEDSRERARNVLKRLKQGLEPFEAPPTKPDSVESVAERWLTRHVQKNKLRTGAEMKRIVEKYILPRWRDRAFADIKRSDVAALLDAIEDAHGAWVADAALSALRGMASWFATRDDTYVPPFVKRMRRVPKHQRKRSRILDDDELRIVWRAAEDAGSYGALVRLLLLTTQRRACVAGMRWDDIDGDIWHVPQEPGAKNSGGDLKLPKMALDIIHAQPKLLNCPYVFAAARGDGPTNNFSRSRASFDAKLPEMPRWTLHDLRRCARSLLSRCGVRPDICERVLGHVVGSAVERIYDQHRYNGEKADALHRLAALIEQIVHGEPGGNVLTFPAAVS